MARRRGEPQLTPVPPVAARWELNTTKEVEAVGRGIEGTLQVELEDRPRLKGPTQRPPLEVGSLPVLAPEKRPRFVGNDVPAGDQQQIQLADAEHMGTGHEVDVAGGLPDAGAAD